MNRDWFFSDERSLCGFRAAGVLLSGGKILVQRDNGGNEYALPGGHVKAGETSAETLVRKFKEETGADITVNRLVWVEEAFWKWGEKDAHTIAFYYLIALQRGGALRFDGIKSHKNNCDV